MMKIKEEPKVDLSDFPGMLQKLEKRQEVIDSLVKTVDTLVEYIKKGFRLSPGDSYTFCLRGETFGPASSDYHCVDVYLSALKRESYSFRHFLRSTGGKEDCFSVPLKVENFMSLTPITDVEGFISLMPDLVAEVRKSMLLEIQRMEDIANSVRKSSLV
ncbi:MAG: hypothetical protein HGA67_01280 [Candidatus Yonathbacteria bacterium]|nr:hypothetical protein [Candidatus Yonathbacteria bacterium]